MSGARCSTEQRIVTRNHCGNNQTGFDVMLSELQSVKLKNLNWRGLQLTLMPTDSI